MFEFIGGVFALGIVAQVVFWIAVGLLFPIFWLWMLIDAIVRPEEEYPSGYRNEKVVWIIAMVVFQFASVLYFPLVFRTKTRAAQTPVAGQPAAV